MIVINKGQNSTVILTLTEKATLTSPVFLFRFINDMQRTEKSFIAADRSSYPYRYNEFLITETSGSEILTSGTITLSPQGFWHYEIYEQASTTNTNYLLSLTPQSPLEIGKVKVIGTPEQFNNHDGEQATYKVYE